MYVRFHVFFFFVTFQKNFFVRLTHHVPFPPFFFLFGAHPCLCYVRGQGRRQLAMWQPSLFLVTIDVIWCIWGGMIDL